MSIRQVSVFIENKSGRIADIINVLGENEINIQALSIADTTDFGIARIITDKPEKAARVLKDFGVIVKVTEVIGVIIPDKPGGLSGALNVLKKNEVDINYLYAYIGKNGKNAIVMMKVVSEPERAIQVLTESGYSIVDEEEIHN